MHQLGYEVLITVLIPGLLLAGAAGLALQAWAPEDLAELREPLAGAAFGEGVALLALAAALGSGLGTMMWVAELRLLDPRSARKLEICDGQFNKEWSRYVDSLREQAQAHNSHISRMVHAFYFELRGGTALGVLAVSMFVATGISAWVPVVLFAIGGWMVKDSVRIHLELAKYRHRHHDVPNIHVGTTTVCGNRGCPPAPANGQTVVLPSGNNPGANVQEAGLTA